MKRKTIAIFAVIILLILGYLGIQKYSKKEIFYSTKSKEALTHYKKGVNFVLMYYIKDAKKEFSLAIEKDPNFPLPYIYLIMLSMNEKGKGITNYYKKIAVPQKNWTKFEKDMVSTFMEFTQKRENIKGDEKFAGKIKELINRYEKNIEIYPILLPMYKQAVGDTDKMIEYYEYLHEKFPNNAQIINELGYMYMRKRDYKKAENYFKKYIFVEPQNANPYDSIADLYYAGGDLKKAMQYYQKALEIKPDFLNSKIKLSLCYINLGQVNQALEILNSLEKNEKNEIIRNIVGMLKTFAYANIKDTERLRKLAENSGKNCFSAIAKGFLFYLEKDKDNLAKLLNSYQDKCKDRFTRGIFLFLKTALLFWNHKDKEAFRIIKKFKSYDYSSTAIFKILAAKNLIKMKKFKEAEKQCEGLNEGDASYIKMLIAKAKKDKENCVKFAKKLLEYYNESDKNFYKRKEAELCLSQMQ